MTKDDVRAAAKRLVEFHEIFALRFGKVQAQDNAFTYIKGLMICRERKSIEPIVLNVGNGNVSAMQKFINSAPWDHEEVQDDVQHYFNSELVPTAATSSIGVVGVVDESGFTKKGKHSAGVARQYNGRLGKKDNCQVGVFLTGVTPGGTALLGHQLYLPEQWCDGTAESTERRNKAHVPDGVTFQTKPEIAANLIRTVAVIDAVQLDWITADELYGRNGHFLDELEELDYKYVVEVPVNIRAWTTDPALCVPESSGHGGGRTRPLRDSLSSVKDIAAGVPASAWRTIEVAQGGTDLRFGSAFDHWTGSALGPCSQRGASVRLSLRPCSREDDRINSSTLTSGSQRGASVRLSLRPCSREDDKTACQRGVCVGWPASRFLVRVK